MTFTMPSSKKTPIDTSIGALYTRSLNVGNLTKLVEVKEDESLGKMAIQLATTRNTDDQEFKPLTDEDIQLLNENDFRLLACEIGRRSGISEIPEGPILVMFGQEIRKVVGKFAESSRESVRRMNAVVGQAYGFLNSPTLAKLQEQLGGLSKLTTSAQSLRDHFEQAGWKKGLEVDRSLQSAVEMANRNKSPFAQSIIETPRISLYEPPPFDKTPLGRATLENARSTQEVAHKMDSLVEVVGGLNQTLIAEVLPAWISQVEQEQAEANKSFMHAAKGLWWTKWAVIVSVIVTVLATWWQVSVARDIDAGNSAQMAKSEALLREQIELQKKLLEAQERTLIELKSAPGKKKPGDATEKIVR